MGSKSKRKSYKKQKREFEDVIESDETFAFIVGYTSGGVPYSVTWEEMECAPEADKEEDIDLPFD